MACQLSAEHLHPTKKRMSVSIPDIEQLHCAVHVYCRSMLLTFQVMPSLANSFDNLHSRCTQKTRHFNAATLADTGGLATVSVHLFGSLECGCLLC